MKFLQFFARIVIQVALLTSAVAYASPITYTFTGNGSGTLDGMSFTNTDFTITAIGDTSTFAPCCGANAVLDTSASIQVDGFSSVDFLGSTSVFYQSPGFVVFMQTNAGNLYDGLVSDLAGWNMTSSVGPVDGDGTLLQWGTGILTSGGDLAFDNSSSSPFTFQASLDSSSVPEPSVLWLMAIGLASAAAIRYSRRNRM